MGKLMNIYFSAKAGSSLLKKTGIMDKITVDKLAAEEQDYIASHDIGEGVDVNYADMKYNEIYDTNMEVNTRFSVANLYADAVQNGLADGTLDDAAVMLDYARNIPADKQQMDEYNKQFDPKIVEAYNKQAEEYAKFRDEFDSLSDEQRSARVNDDPRYAVMGACYEYDKASAKAFTQETFMGTYGMSGLKYLKEREDTSLVEIAQSVRELVENKLKSWGIKEETVDRISNFVFKGRADHKESEEYKESTEFYEAAESRGVNLLDLSNKADEMTAKRVDQAKAAGVYKEDASASTQKTASNEASMA